jgi:hypothetical protein
MVRDLTSLPAKIVVVPWLLGLKYFICCYYSLKAWEILPVDDYMKR